MTKGSRSPASVPAARSGPLLTAPEVAKLLRVCERSVYDWSQEGSLPVVTLRNGKRPVRRWRLSDVEAFIEARVSAG